MVISAIGNITVLVLLIKRRMRTPSRLDIMLTHLAIADLMVSFCEASNFCPTIVSSEDKKCGKWFVIQSAYPGSNHSTSLRFFKIVKKMKLLLK